MKDFEKTSHLDNIIEKTLNSLKTIGETETVFGTPIKFNDGTEVVPVSKVTIGFVVGGGEYSDLSARRVANHYPMAGGSGGAAVVNPIGFLVSTESQVKFISTENKADYEKILEIFAKTSSKVAKYMAKREENKNEKSWKF